MILLNLPPDSLKSSIEQRRIAMAVQGLVTSEDTANVSDPKEEELKKNIEMEKER